MLAPQNSVASAPDPDRDCPLCPRLVAFRTESRFAEPSWHNAPVPTFGAGAASLLIVGLAPGLRGANRTGRPFTGDYAGELLYATLIAYGFAHGTYAARPDDGMQLVDCRLTNAVRCVPPQNKPTPAEMTTCRPFLSMTLAALPQLRAVLALGHIAHQSVLRAFGAKLSAFAFKHGARHTIAGPSAHNVTLFDSYHCSRYNTNTGVLTPEMFHQVFAAIRAELDAQQTPLHAPA